MGRGIDNRERSEPLCFLRLSDEELFPCFPVISLVGVPPERRKLKYEPKLLRLVLLDDAGPSPATHKREMNLMHYDKCDLMTSENN